MIDVSLIIVNWNTEKLLLLCIESIISQTEKVSYEIIVVDNASEDNSVSSVKAGYPDVKIIENTENLGFSKANNQGFAVSRGRYVCLINSDVIVLDNSIDRLISHIDDDDSIGVIVPMTINGENRIRQNVRRFPNLWNIFCETLFLHRLFKKTGFFCGRAIPSDRYHKLYEVESISGCFMVVRRKAMEQIGTLDEAFFFYTEDVDWCKRFYDAGWKIIYLADVKSVHLGGESSSAAPAKYQRIMETSDLIYWTKHFSKAAVGLYKFLRKTKCHLSILIIKLSSGTASQEDFDSKIAGFQARIEVLRTGVSYERQYQK